MLKRIGVCAWHMSAILLFGVFSMYYVPPIINDYPDAGVVLLVAMEIVLLGWGYHIWQTDYGVD